MSDVLARITPTLSRRVAGTGALVALGLLLASFALRTPPEPTPWRPALGLLGVVMLWQAVRLWRATALGIELTPDVVRDTSGRVLAEVAQIRRLERGVFAFKPSNGFLIRLAAPGAFVWAPGLWWRVGTRVGVGGVTPAWQSRHMAETLAALQADSDAASRNAGR